MRKLMLLVIIFFIGILTGCQQAGLTEKEIRDIVRTEVGNQLTSIRLETIVQQEVNKQMADSRFKYNINQIITEKLNSLDVLIASRLLIKNEDGEYVADIGAHKNKNGYIGIKNAEGHELAFLGGTEKGECAFALYNSKEQRIVFLGAEGTYDYGVLSISNSYGDEIFALGAPGGDGHLVIIDKFGNVIFQVP